MNSEAKLTHQYSETDLNTTSHNTKKSIPIKQNAKSMNSNKNAKIYVIWTTREQESGGQQNKSLQKEHTFEFGKIGSRQRQETLALNEVGGS